MVGRPMRKVFCSGRTRAGLREGKNIPCRMKGYPLSDGKTFKCKYHGFSSVDRFNKASYTDETRIKQLKGLYQFKNYTDEQIKEYYYTKTKPRIDNRAKSIYYRRKAKSGSNPFRDFVGGSRRKTSLSFQLDEVSLFLKKKSRDRNKD